MSPIIISPLIASLLLLFCFGFQFTNATTITGDTIRAGQSLNTFETIESANGMYKLGFFSQENSAKYHVGISFRHVSDRNVLWVANREKPFPNSSAVLTLKPDGNLVISDGSLLYVVTNTSGGNDTYARLLDTVRQPIGRVTVCQDSKPMQPILLKDVREKEIYSAEMFRNMCFFPCLKFICLLIPSSCNTNSTKLKDNRLKKIVIPIAVVVALSLIAWELWTSDRGSELVDPLLDDISSMQMVLRYVHIALLCIQESAEDRPIMSDVVAMLSNESAVLPYPNEPAFLNVRNMSKANPVNRSGYINWTSDRGSELVDPLLDDISSMQMVLRYVHIALLCIQESAKDRPTMYDVVAMLSNESAVLPYPNEPAFLNVRNMSKANPVNRSGLEICSVSGVTFSIMNGQ
ncbi:hypothetical protein FH972_020257 [Carpinus fangiana]|uniref:Bulb-type lectin domain-containing protein n=1 Tax=Carpinus fangiana TaxID=176857 RepID=A0A5N6RVU5_9ROSI|nr:hypothetical protein FH972_020257 [Carpinus fangiana]